MFKCCEAGIVPELYSALKALRRFISAKEKMQLVEKIPDISELSGGSATWFFAPLDEGVVASANMRKFVSAIESTYCGIECGHFSLSPNMHVYVALVYLLCERIGGSATSMARQAVEHLLSSVAASGVDKTSLKDLLLTLDKEIPASPDSEVSYWQGLLNGL